MGARLAVLVDFDNTAATGDVGVSLIERFARDDSWRVIDNDYLTGRIGSRTAYRKLETLLEGDVESWLEFCRDRFDLDAGLEPLINKVEGLDGRIEILSDGLDVYIDAMLGIAGLELPVKCNLVEKRGNCFKITTPEMSPLCGRCGTCKRERVESLSAEGYLTVYVGDGYSDLCGAQAADVIFAKHILADHLKEISVDFIPFDTLVDVAQKLRDAVAEVTGG